jgi:Ca-activated chloride channel family protein
MYGEGRKDLEKAMEFILSDAAKKSMIQFSSEDKIDVIAFGSHVRLLGSASGNDTKMLLQKIKEYDFDGATSLFPAAQEAINILKSENDSYNSSVILMTDGEGNSGSFEDTKRIFEQSKNKPPIYSITFGDADEEQLEKLADLSNGKVFDGKTNLVKAFKSVRGYN